MLWILALLLAVLGYFEASRKRGVPHTPRRQREIDKLRAAQREALARRKQGW